MGIGGASAGRRRQCRRDRRRGRLQHASQVLGEVGRRGVPILLPLRQRLEADPLQIGGNVADELARRLRLVVAHLPHQLRDGRGPERHAAGEHFVEDHAQAVHVGAAVDAMRRALRLFRRHVPRRPGDETFRATARLLLAERQTEVHQHGRDVRP